MRPFSPGPRARRDRAGSLAALLLWLALPILATAAEGPPPPVEVPGDEEVVTYPAAFFQRYQPLTALDMVNQLPGFQLDDGADKRGFGSAAGNILINDRRPSAKQDAPSAILDRIPAAIVERIELIRGRVRDIDLQGRAVLANVILGADLPAAIRWESFARHYAEAPFRLGASLSLSDRWQAVDYNVGVEVERDANGEVATEELVDGLGRLTETRSEDKEETGFNLRGVYLNAASWVGNTLVQANTKFGYSQSEEHTLSARTPQAAGSRPFDIVFVENARTPQFEVGVDAERLLRRDLHGKAILLFNRRDRQIISSQRSFDSDGDETRFRRSDDDTVSSEGIARLEFDWAGWSGHLLQANLETAYNLLDSSLVQVDDSGGGLVVVDIPNGNTRVEEVRGDVLLQDTWSFGQWTLDVGLGAETSTITQTGDAEQERSFFFLKPRALLTWSPTPSQQTQVQLAREVAQLDFNDFVSATVFQDDDLALGNPDLKPETTWLAEVTHERRFGELGVIAVTAFHHWIRDVQDLLPLDNEFEAPGNIGNGRRWGAILKGTLPLGWTGLKGARLDVQARWQDSVVTDPVTGEERILSAEAGFSGPPTIGFEEGSEYVLDIAFRQDLREARWAWGWDIAEQAERPRFKVNELDVFDEGLELNAFIETTRWWGVKMRLEVANLLDYVEHRDRSFYTGLRELTAVDRRLLREGTPEPRIALSLSGSF